MSELFAAGLILLAAAAAAGLIAWRPGRLRGAPYALGAAGAACLAAVGGSALSGQTVRLNVAGWLAPPAGDTQTSGLAVDRLSGLFLLMALGAAVPVSAAFASWAAGPGSAGPEPAATRLLAQGYALALGATTVIMTAQDAFTALFGWEALTAAFFLLAGARRGDPDRVGAARITVAFGQASGAALLIGLLLLATRSHSLALASFATVPGGAARTAAIAALMAGFTIKAGMVPFQVWLPRGYAAAPPPARAVMAGVCVNVGFYGLWRTLALLGRPPGWLAGILLILSGLSALLGIAHAAVQTRLSRVIAYSSVENSGLIITGFGVALTGASIGDQRLAAIGLLAATLQLVTHTIAKSLLFSSAAGLEAVAGSDDLEALRGLRRRSPWSAAGLAVGSLTLAGLPPTAGFVSEWFLLESLMQQVRVASLGGRLTLALAGAAVALTAGFAGVTFVRLVGMVVLGPQGGDGGRGAPPCAGGDRSPRGNTDRPRCPRAALGRLPGDRRAHPARDPGDRGRAVAGRPERPDDGSAEVPLGAAAGLRRLLDPVALLAVGRAPGDAGPGHPAGLRVVRTAAAASPPGPGLALGDDRRPGGRLLHPLRLREPHPPGARQRAAPPRHRAAAVAKRRRRRRRLRGAGSASALRVRRGRGRRELAVPARGAGVRHRRGGRQATAVRPPGRLPALHADRPRRRGRARHRPGVTSLVGRGHGRPFTPARPGSSR